MFSNKVLTVIMVVVAVSLLGVGVFLYLTSRDQATDTPLRTQVAPRQEAATITTEEEKAELIRQINVESINAAILPISTVEISGTAKLYASEDGLDTTIDVSLVSSSGFEQAGAVSIRTGACPTPGVVFSSLTSQARASFSVEISATLQELVYELPLVVAVSSASDEETLIACGDLPGITR